MAHFDDIAGKTALITGASGGLGLHFAELLARQGARVVLAARRRGALQDHCKRLTAAGATAVALELDVTRSESIAQALAEFGEPVDILINNAGIATGVSASDLSEAEWDNVIDTNLKGAFLLSQAVAPRMKLAGGGTIVNIASILGLRVASHVAAYATSKAGLIQLTKALALEWARDSIRVNALCPGYVETDLNRDFFAGPAGQRMIQRIPMRRLGQLDDLDGALLLMCSDAGRYITGATLAVDGGHLVSSL